MSASWSSGQLEISEILLNASVRGKEDWFPYNGGKHAPVVDSKVLDEEQSDITSESRCHDGCCDERYADGHQLRAAVLDFRHCDRDETIQCLRYPYSGKGKRDRTTSRVCQGRGRERNRRFGTSFFRFSILTGTKRDGRDLVEDMRSWTLWEKNTELRYRGCVSAAWPCCCHVA